MEVWSEDDDAGAEELDKVDNFDFYGVDGFFLQLIYQAEGDENRRRRIACAVAVMCQLVVKMTTSALHSYQEQASSIAPLILHLQSLQATIVKAKNIKRRRIEKEWWVKPRSLVWSDRFVTGAMDRETFKKLFNMSACTFEWLCCQLAPLVLKTDTNFRSSIPPRKRIAIGIHRLACGSSYLEVSKMFAVGEATVLTCTRELYGALVAAFGHVLAFPRGDSLNKVIEGFRVITGLPNCCGVIGSSRFKIKRPTGPCGTDYLDDEKSFSVGAQIVVDSSMRILHIAVGFPGSVQGSKILKVSGLFEKVKNGMLLDGPAVLARSINRVRSHVKIPQYLIGDLKYPLLPWMMVPYNDLHHHSHHNLLHQQQQQQQHQQQQLGLWKMKLNRKMSECSFLVEHVLMGLRKWGVLEKSMNVDVQTGVELVVSCAILHNVLVEKNEYGDLMMMQQQQQQQQQFQQQQQQQQFQQQQQEMMLMMMMMMERTEFPNENGYDGNADDIRDALASHVLLSA